MTEGSIINESISIDNNVMTIIEMTMIYYYWD